MKQPTAPNVTLNLGDDFQFGPTVLQSDAQPTRNGTNGIRAMNCISGTNDGVDVTSLDVLENFTGTFTGFGFNQIFRPNSQKTPTPLPATPASDDPDDNILQLNLTSESMAFTKPLGNVPNRGLDAQADIMLNGLPYTQTISDITRPDPRPPVIHFETGLWMRVPQSSEMPNLDASYARMASIPHGTAINAQCFQQPLTSAGAPEFPSVSITPISIQNGKKVPFKSQTAVNGDTHRLPQDLLPFEEDGTITQAILDDPNNVLRNANEGKEIVENTSFTVSSALKQPELGGGTSNIGFLVGADAGITTASVNNRSGNANAVQVQSQYWISKVRVELDLEPSEKSDKPKRIVSPTALGPRDAVPKFIVDIDVPSAKMITVEYTQIQYSQTVILDFNGLSWPHVTVGTLAPTGHKLSSVIVA
ncbi:Fc.00g034390.m01.CDS01 [Cosmosporella sp. VM-42]